MLLNKLKKDTVVWGKRVHDYHENSDSVTIQFVDGEVISSDLLIGTDGKFSIQVQVKYTSLK